MKIIQFLPTLAYGDAIGNETFALQDYMRKKGYETEIYAESILPPLKSDAAHLTDKMPQMEKDDIAIYHLSTGSKLTYRFAELGCKKVVIYHNITPPCFFETYDNTARRMSKWGIDTIRFLADKVDLCIADSEYNRAELIRLGYRCPVEVLPILLDFSDYEKEADPAVLRQYTDGHVNVLFTGRIVPNKNIEAVIQTFIYFKKYYQPSARLFLVGNPQSIPAYSQQLRDYIRDIGAKDIFFTGHIKFAQILAYYRVADVFLCMSRHEGFCVPLVEAMYFNVPVVAAASSAVPDTLGGSGILLEDPDPLEAAGMISRLVKDPELKEQVQKNQRARLRDFSYEKVSGRFGRLLKQVAGAEA